MLLREGPQGNRISMPSWVSGSRSLGRPDGSGPMSGAPSFPIGRSTHDLRRRLVDLTQPLIAAALTPLAIAISF
jgi:hypothetical protein